MRLLTIGTFDGLHVGHLELLQACRDLAGRDGRVMVGVNRDGFVKRYKGHEPVRTLRHRIEMLRAVRAVDDVFVNVGDENSGVLIEAVNPDALAIGDDWLDAGNDQRRYLAQLGITVEWLREMNLFIHYIPRTRGVSSTALRAL